MRIGIGFDVHRLVIGRKLFLGGIEIPYEKGLLGHSDGDVLLHAVSDAILGALSEGDIGLHFPDSDPDMAGIDSIRILSRTVDIANSKGYRILNVDAVVLAEKPKIAPYRELIRQKIAGTLAIDVGSVGIKGKTTEGLGFTGRCEGIAVHAVALLKKK